ncbi:MAG: NAD/NADP octopine/nopaline dehydrogenase family protein [Prevotella sp.]|nr:NAD/NADP octopine/nopaline dehydrogenase family protein [Bacteroides sp.]MCM1365717.1 NAD/NADP octopine/nopaline dehydrogenase family protein [Prevotella sp.]MCM1436387.1 NAD/NADP octopine/nopaline dehydrogenase family protein [Prevotella sp.]
MFKKICIIGGGSLGHVISGWLANKGMDVSVLTRNPDKWSKNITINTPDGTFESRLHNISSNPADVIPQAEIILLTVPGFANSPELQVIKPHLKSGTYVGGVFCSSGFFFEALEILPPDIKLWGFQRVPFISRTAEYGHTANLMGYRPEFNIAVERDSANGKEELRRWVENSFGSHTNLMKNYFEVSITNSNPILHTARLYSMFSGWEENKRFDRNILFYEEWTIEAAELLIKMDAELFKILGHLPVTPGYLSPIMDYYESHDAKSLKEKLASISGFKGILSPMKQDKKGWYPDYTSRYFTEDFGYSLKYIRELGKKYNVEIPYIDKVYLWGQSLLKKA